MPATLTHAVLKAKEDENRDGFPKAMGLRVHRSISWIGRAEAAADDDDARFIFLWIAFNAVYADERALRDDTLGESSVFGDFFRKAVDLDAGRRVYDAIWNNFSGPIRILMQNRYVFSPFWQHHNGIEGYEDWEDRLWRENRRFERALMGQDTAATLRFVFHRLYVLRNQILHGGATWNSSVNRAQVRDGTAILAFLVPVFVDIMMDNPNEEWGRPFYPVVDEPG